MVWLGIKHFFESFFNLICNVFVIIIGLCAYLIGYPAQKGILIATLTLFTLDTLTRTWAISRQNGGFIKAFINKNINSRSFWNGFFSKSISYFVILVIANLSLITSQVSIIGGIFSSILYVGLFTYEAISNLENLRDASFQGKDKDLYTELINKVKNIKSSNEGSKKE